ncbi:MAG: hypothetical protein JWQ74_1851 [Marmoricola sp.]|nr:hypothetical protein [Marmoricola sp.]
MVTGLTNGQAYTFTVTSSNAVGPSDPSAATEPVAPGADTSQPVLASSSVMPRMVSSLGGTVMVDLRITDEGSGWEAPSGALDANPAVSFKNRANSDQTFGFTRSVSRISGDEYDGVYRATITVPSGLTPGEWDLVAYPIRDVAGNTTSFTTRAGVLVGAPGKPTVASASSGPGRQVTVIWTPPSDNGGNVITSYKVSNSFDSTVATTTSPSWTGAFPAIGADVPLTFSIRAVNAAGEGEPSDTSTPVFVLADAPSQPRTVTGTRGDGSAQVSWIAPLTNGGAAITGYTVRSVPGSKTCTTAGALFCTVAGLTNGTTYTFTVTATSPAGTSAPSAASGPVAPAGVPSAPAKPSATRGNKKVVVSWVTPASAGAAIARYTVRSAPGSKTCTTTGALSCTVAGLTNGTTYTFTVTATNAVGASSPSRSSAPVTPIGPFVKVGTPKISGNARVGSALRVNPGSWSPRPKFAYQWFRNGQPIARATGATYVLAAVDRGSRTTVRVTGSRVGVVTKAVLSNSAPVIGYGILENKRAPTVAGTAKVGMKLTAKPGSWNLAGISLKYQWLRAGKAIRGATGKTYRLTAASKSHRISVRVTASKAGYKTAAKTSKRTAKVAGTSSSGGGNCTAGYSPCLPPMSDYDCAGGSGNGPGYAYGPLYVTGSDPYDLDRDGDGVACED